MLKSTYKAESVSLPPLPEGWTEHKAPTGHSYYYNHASNISTYTRPPIPQDIAHIVPNNGSTPLPHTTSTILEVPPLLFRDGTLNGPTGIVNNPVQSRGNDFRGKGGFRVSHPSSQHSYPKDKPRSKHAIPGCEPWVLVKTRFGRRFVYNPEQNQSFWRFPSHIMKGVIDFDAQERQNRHKLEEDKGEVAEEHDVANAEVGYLVTEQSAPTAAPRPLALAPTGTAEGNNSDDEYEEVEVTDDEDDVSSSKRQKTANDEAEEPVQFNEEDIAYQLEAMGHDYGLDRGEYGNGEEDDLEEGAEGLPLTEADSKALFRDMLDDYRISPYTTWEALIEAGQIIEDDRYTVLPNMRSRKEVWSEWSKDNIQRKKEEREKEQKKNPKVPYFAFLQARATPKLYWPEFRRKYIKEPEMRNTKLPDKDREKWYREHINRLKSSESSLKADLVQLLKSVPLPELNSSTTLDNLPVALLTDIRFISLRPSIRDSLVEAHISSLPTPPQSTDISLEEEEALNQVIEERRRREYALKRRHIQVQEERKKQEGSLRHSKGMLRDGEQEIERAMRVGKDGLLSHMEAQVKGS